MSVGKAPAAVGYAPRLMAMPNFLVIGSGRAGTTSLHHYLRQHPAVFLPAVKSPSYFYCIDAPSASTTQRHLETRSYFVRDITAYETLFETTGAATAIGEVSPAYLSSNRVAGRIAELLPEVRLVATLRNPIERLHSRFVARRRDGLEKAPNLATLLAREKKLPLVREDAAGTYISAGFVSHILDSYFRHFPQEQIRLFLFDDLVRDPVGTVRELFEFLRVDPTVLVDEHVHNRSGGQITNPIVRFLWTRSALPRLLLRGLFPKRMRDGAFGWATRQLRPEPLEESQYLELAQIYQGEIESLGRRLDRDLSHWLQPAATVR